MKRAWIIVALAGCLDAAQPDVGPELGPTCDNTDTDPATPVRFAAEIKSGIIQVRGHCAKCHTPEGATPIGLQIAMFDLSSYESLRRGGRTSGADIVKPGEPCTSTLLRKVSPAPPFGSRMPYDGPPYLGDDDLRLIHDWIAEGAADN